MGIFFAAPTRSYASWSWRSITRGRAVIKGEVKWRVGDGRAIKFWSDWWLNDKALELEEDICIPEGQQGVLVNHYLLADRQWDFRALETILPEEVIIAIRGVLVAYDGDTLDAPSWPVSGTGSFSIKSAYDLIAGNMERDDCLGWVWKLDCIERVRSFIWLVMNASILTNAERCRRGMTEEPACPRCGEEETLLHLFKECPFAQDCWRSCMGGNRIAGSAASVCASWVVENCREETGLVNGMRWRTLFPYVLWNL